ncbi:hypothetical protein M569_17306, partial [Genlisea aurea]
RIRLSKCCMLVGIIVGRSRNGRRQPLDRIRRWFSNRWIRRNSSPATLLLPPSSPAAAI